MKSLRFAVSGTLTLLACVAGCAVKADADPVPVAISIEFPSTPTAVVTDSVRIFVYEGAKDCAELVAIRGSGRPLPAAKIEERRTPCELEGVAGAGIDLDRNKTYTLLVAAQVGEKDLLVGCSQQQAFGEVKALPVTLAYASNEFTLGTIEATTPGATTRCVKLSDKCNNSCAK
jgi:hypothetical protein